MLALAAVWAVWIVVAQAFLWTPLLRYLLNSQGPILQVQYAFAWSVWPGVVHARDLVITSQDRAVQWRLGLDRVSTSIALGQIPSRIFHATHVRAHGVVFAVRRRIRAAEVTPARTAGLPHFQEFAALPLKEEGPDDILPDSRYKLVSVWLEDVEGQEVRQVWFDQFRLEGRGRVSGAFYLKPLRRVLVAPAELDIEEGQVLRGEERIAEAVRGPLRVRLGEFDPRGIEGKTLAGKFDLDTDLRAHLEKLPFAKGSADAHALLRVARGKVQDGSSIEAKIVQARSGPAKAGSIVVRAGVEGELHATLEATSLRVPGAVLERGRVQLSGDAPDLADPELPRHAVIDLRGGRIDDASALQGLFLDEERFEAGQGTFSAHLEGPTRKLEGWARAQLSQVRLRARGLVVEGDVRVDAKVPRLSPESADLAGTRIEIENGRLHGEDIAPAWWGRFVLQKGSMRFDGRRIETDFAAHCRDARPIVGLFARLADLPGIVKGLFSMDGLSLEGSASVAPDFFELRDLLARGDGATIQATVRQDHGVQRGAAVLDVRGIPVALDLNDGASLHPFGPFDFYNERRDELAQTPRKAAPKARRPPASPR